MKKIIMIFLATVMIFALATPALAADTNTINITNPGTLESNLNLAARNPDIRFDLYIGASFNLLAGATYTIPANAYLIIGEGFRLNANGAVTINNHGVMIINGTFNYADTATFKNEGNGKVFLSETGAVGGAGDFNTAGAPILTSNYYIVEFAADFGTIYGAARHTVAIAKAAPTLTAPAEPQRAFYKFLNWTTDDAGINIWNFANPVTGNLVLHAQWVPLTSTVTYIDWNGSVYFEEEVEYGHLATEPAEPQRNGYKFLGWFTAASGGTIWDFEEGIFANLTLYAQYEIIEYKICYELDGAKNHPDNPLKYTIEDTPVTIKDPEKIGYIFLGWTSVELDITTPKAGLNIIPAGQFGDIKLTAHWKYDDRYNFFVYVEEYDTLEAKAGDTYYLKLMLVGNLNFTQVLATVAYDSDVFSYVKFVQLADIASAVNHVDSNTLSVRSAPTVNMFIGAPCDTPVMVALLEFKVADKLGADSVTADFSVGAASVYPTAGIGLPGIKVGPGNTITVTLKE